MEHLNKRSKIPGVYWQVKRKRWSVKLGIDRILMFFGYFKTQPEAEQRAIEIRREFPKNKPYDLVKQTEHWQNYH